MKRRTILNTSRYLVLHQERRLRRLPKLRLGYLVVLCYRVLLDALRDKAMQGPRYHSKRLHDGPMSGEALLNIGVA